MNDFITSVHTFLDAARSGIDRLIHRLIDHRGVAKAYGATRHAVSSVSSASRSRAAAIIAHVQATQRETRLPLKDQVFFAKRLSFLMNAGISIVDGLHVLREQATSKSQHRMLELVLVDITNGQTLATAFGKFPRAFSQFSIHLIKIGESSGTLAQNLEYLADELKKSQILRRKVIGALIYPVVITVATIGITAFLMMYLFPKIVPVFASLHMELPLPTRIVMAISTFLQHWGLLTLAVLVVAAFGGNLLLGRHIAVRRFFDRVVLGVPVFGPMIRSYNLANVSRTLGLLLKSGVKLSDALMIASETTKNVVYSEACRDVARAVIRGERVSTHLREYPKTFTDVFAHLVAVGEESGTLPRTLDYLSDMYEGEVEDFTKNLSTLIEPVLMIIMGILVGFIAISIITPIYSITQNLHG